MAVNSTSEFLYSHLSSGLPPLLLTHLRTKNYLNEWNRLKSWALLLVLLFCLIFISFWGFYKLCHHVHSLPTPLWFNPLPYPLDFLSLSLFSSIKSNLYYPYTIGNMAFHWQLVGSPRTTLFKENQLFTHSYQLPIAPQLEVEFHVPPLFSMLRFCVFSIFSRSWACCHNCCELICTCATSLLCPENTLFPVAGKNFAS